MKTSLVSILWIGLSILLIGAACAQTQPPTADPAPTAAAPVRPTLTLAPAVVLVKTKPGQGWTQTLRMSNLTPAPFRFEIEVQDVVVKDGKRTFVPAGEIEGGIAISAVSSPKSVEVLPQSEGSVTVTLTVPMKTEQRAVVVYFRGKVDRPMDPGSVALGASLGALITFDLAGDSKIEPLAFSSTPQTDTSNLTISHELRNSGHEVVVPKGSMAILDEAGRRVSKATFDPRRLLPGEQLVFTTTNPSQLRPGHYRVVSSFEYAGKIVTAGGEFSVQ